MRLLSLACAIAVALLTVAAAHTTHHSQMSHSAGSIQIDGSCCPDVKVYAWVVYNAEMVKNATKDITLPFEEKYMANVGTSVKLTLDKAVHPGDANINQIEYTWAKDQGVIYYDSSDIDGHHLNHYGLSIIPSDDRCAVIKCPPGKGKCELAYKYPTDDKNTHTCRETANLTVKLFTHTCPTGSPRQCKHDLFARQTELNDAGRPWSPALITATAFASVVVAAGMYCQ